MAEYIEREGLKKNIREKVNPEKCTHIIPQDVYSTVLTVVECEPAADVAEVKHSFWKTVDCGPDWCEAECSQCGDKYAFTPYRDFYKYCPSCGAKMDLRGDKLCPTK